MNPFDYNHPARQDIFAGRSSELEWVKQSFEKALYGQPSHLFLYGPRRMGKTSFLWHIKHLFQDFDGNPFLILIVSVGDCRNLSDLTKKIIETLYLEVQSQKNVVGKVVEFLRNNFRGIKIGEVGIEWNREESMFDEPRQFTRVLVQLWKKLAEAFKGLAIIVDETDPIIKDKRFAGEFIFSLKTFIEEIAEKGICELKFIISALPELYEVIPEYNQHLLRIFDIKAIEQFDEDAARILLRNGLKLASKKKFGLWSDEKRFTEDFFSACFRISDGIPYHLQLIYHRAFELDDDGKLTEEDFDRAVFGHQKKEGVLDILHHVSFGPLYQRAKSASSRSERLLTVLSEVGGELTLDDLQRHFPGVSRETLSSNMASLRSNDFLTPSKGQGIYTVSSKLCRCWIDRRVRKIPDKDICVGT